jgi:hypothetical protein
MLPQYLRNEFYQKKSPLFHVGSYMKKTLDENDQVSERLLSMVFKNISEKHIIAIQGVIHNFNPFNESLIETPFTLIEIPNFKPGTLFGETVYFKVHPAAVIFKIEIKRVTYTGFETETFEDNSYEKIERPLEPSNVLEKQYIFNKFNQGFEYIQDIKIEDAYYQCVCGTMNHIKNSVCIECRAPKETYIKIFKEEHIKKIISEDADLYVESVFKDSVVSFDMNEETIEKLIQSRGNTHIIEIVQKEKERYQRIDNVIRPKVDNTIHIALFDRLMQKIDKVNTEIQNKKVLKDKEISNKIREENKQYIINNIKKDIDYEYFVLDLNSLVKDFKELEFDTNIIKIFYEFKTNNKDRIVAEVKEKSMNIFGYYFFRNNILFSTCIVKNKKLVLSKYFDEYNVSLYKLEAEVLPYLEDYSLFLKVIFNSNNLIHIKILSSIVEQASSESFFQSIVNGVIAEEKKDNDVPLDKRKYNNFCLSNDFMDSLLKLELNTQEAKKMIKKLLELNEQSEALILNTSSHIRRHYKKNFFVKLCFAIGLGIPHIALFNLAMRDSVNIVSDFVFVVILLGLLYGMFFVSISFWYKSVFPEQKALFNMKEKLINSIKDIE